MTESLSELHQTRSISAGSTGLHRPKPSSTPLPHLLAKASQLDPRAVVTVSRRSLTDIAPGSTGRVITKVVA